MHKPLTVVLFAILTLTLARPLQAQVYSSVDTLGTVTTGGFPGDTVTVLFDLVNTFAVGGFQVRVTYDTASFTPLDMSLGARATLFEIFGSNFDVPGVASFYATTWRPLDYPILPGRGPIIELDLQVRGGAVPGIYYFRFENIDSLSHQNALSNAIGDTLFIPVFEEQQIMVLPVESVNDGNGLPAGFSLAQNYPNPFNGETKIGFSLATSSQVELSVIDLLGRLIATPYQGVAPAGESSVIWNGRGFGGEEVTSGIYYYSLIVSGGKSVTHQMTLLK